MNSLEQMMSKEPIPHIRDIEKKLDEQTESAFENPPIERTAAEVVDRMLALMLLPVISDPEVDLDLEDALEWFDEHGLEATFTDEEVSYPNTEQGRIDASWCIESAWALAWTLGLTPELGAFVSGRYGDWFYENVFDADPAELRRTAQLIPDEQIWAMFDRIVYVHWSFRHYGDVEGAELSVVMERHQALAWLTTPDEGWNEVTQDT